MNTLDSTSKVDTVHAAFAPDFILADLNGNPHHLSELRGKVVVLNFWATWCSPCRAEIPTFNRLQDSLGGNKIQFLGVALDDGGDSVVRHWTKSNPVSYPILLPDDSILIKYGPVDAIPQTYFIDKKGRIRSSIVGTRTRVFLDSTLHALISE